MGDEENYTESLRIRVRAAMGACDACGRTLRSQRAVSKESGVLVSTLCRFLQGRPVNSDSIDRLAAWASSHGQP